MKILRQRKPDDAFAPCRVLPETLVFLALARQFAGYNMFLRFNNRSTDQMLHDATDDQVNDEQNDSGEPVDDMHKHHKPQQYHHH